MGQDRTSLVFDVQFFSTLSLNVPLCVPTIGCTGDKKSPSVRQFGLPRTAPKQLLTLWRKQLGDCPGTAQNCSGQAKRDKRFIQK